MRSFAIISVLLLLTSAARADYVFDSNCRAAYQAAWSLEPVMSFESINLEAKQHPSNSIPIYLSSLNQFISAFVFEEKSDYQKFKSDESARLDALVDDNNGPWYFYCRSEIYLEGGVLRLKFSDYLGAAYDFNKAYNNLTECNNKYPDFLPAQKDLLLLKAIVGSVPDKYRWMMKILGFNGDLKTSMSKYKLMLYKIQRSPDYNIFTKEARVMYSYLNFYMLNNPGEAWTQIDMAAKDYESNPIDAFVKANIALRVKKNDIAIETLSRFYTNAPIIPYLDYMLGVAKLQRGDKNAGFYLGRYLKEYKGEHYIKDAWLKLGWAFFLVGDIKHYESAMKLVSEYGTTQLEEDKNAQREALASQNLVPDVLRARLYFDGGYLDKALNEIQKVKISALSNDRQRVEYNYRYARILDAAGQDRMALSYYQTVIDKYSNVTEGNPPQNIYFAPASRLFAGMIWEKNNDPATAKKYFLQCLSYKDYVYKDSFDQKAYSGLKRISH